MLRARPDGVGTKAASILRHLSYANVMATMALMVALGGASYAAVAINGRQILAHSISASKLARGIVVPRAQKANQVSTLRLSHGKRRHSGKLARIASAGPSGVPTLITMSYGQSVPVIQDGPFSISARCETGSGSMAKFYLDATSTDSSWTTYVQDSRGGGTKTLGAGDTAEIYEGGGSSPNQTTINGFVLTDSLGDAYVFNFAVSVHEQGDCAVAGYGVG